MDFCFPSPVDAVCSLVFNPSFLLGFRRTIISAAHPPNTARSVDCFPPAVGPSLWVVHGVPLKRPDRQTKQEIRLQQTPCCSDISSNAHYLFRTSPRVFPPPSQTSRTGSGRPNSEKPVAPAAPSRTTPGVAAVARHPGLRGQAPAGRVRRRMTIEHVWRRRRGVQGGQKGGTC